MLTKIIINHKIITAILLKFPDSVQCFFMYACKGPMLAYLFFFFFFFFFRALPAAHEISQAKGQIRAAAASLYHSHGNMGSELYLQPTPKLTATVDP